MTMFDYFKFKSAARRYRHETAADTANGRMSYEELSASVTAAFNSLCIAGASERAVTVLSRDPLTVITFALACSRAGCALTVADPRLCLADAALVAARRPSLVLLPAGELGRIGGLFLENGCTTAIVAGQTDKNIFPSQFCCEELLKLNDFLSGKEYPNGSLSFFADGDAVAFPLPELAPRTPVAVAVPPFSGRAAVIYSALLYGGRRICLTAPNKKTAVVCDERQAARYQGLCAGVIPAPPSSSVYAGGGLFDGATLSKRLCEATGEQMLCEADGDRVRVVMITDGERALTPALRSALSDLLYPFDCKRTLVFRKKTN